MKNIFFLFFFLLCQSVFSQRGLRFPSTEFFTTSISVDPSSSVKEDGLDVVAEIEYAGFLYTKAGFESFSALYGGYHDIHVAIGINLTAGLHEKVRFYSGIRAARVFRGHEGAYRINYGLEGGIDIDLSKNFFVGLRATYDKRYDQEIYRWNPELKASGFIRIGYKWYYKKH